jgi:hypothetical protein
MARANVPHKPSPPAMDWRDCGCSRFSEPPQLTSQHVQVPDQCQRLFGEATCSEISISASSWSATTSTMHPAYAMTSHGRASTLLTGALGASGAAGSGVQPLCIESSRTHGVDDGSLTRSWGCPAFRRPSSTLSATSRVGASFFWQRQGAREHQRFPGPGKGP